MIVGCAAIPRPWQAAFVLLLTLLTIAGRTHARLRAELKIVSFSEKLGDEAEVLLSPPRGAYHLFASHCWLWAQDQVGVCKNLLRALLPECRVFLDVDNLETISDLEMHIAESDVILIMLTRGYIASKNCRRELLEAMRLHKPIVILQETDPSKGAAHSIELSAEIEQTILSPAELGSCTELIRLVEQGGVADPEHMHVHVA